MVISDRNGTQSSERNGIFGKTSANAEKVVVDCSREEQMQTPKVASSDLIRESHGDGTDIERGDSITLSKRKMDFVVDLDSAIDGRRDVCTSSSDNLHSSSECKTDSIFRRCAACSKRQRYFMHIQKSSFLFVFFRFLILGFSGLNSRLSKYKLYVLVFSLF